MLISETVETSQGLKLGTREATRLLQDPYDSPRFTFVARFLGKIART